MKQNHTYRFVALWGILAFVSCGGASGPTLPSQTPSGNLPMGELESAGIILKSDDLADISTLVKDASLYVIDSSANDCTLRASSEEASGACLTPLNLSGYAASVNLGSAEAGEGPGRLFGSTSYSISLNRYGELEVAPFDLQEPITMSASSNLEDAGAGATWNTVIVYTAVMDVQVEIKNTFWTLRFAFVSQQPADEEILDGCVDDYYRERIEQSSGLLASGETEGTYRKGDVMVCMQDSADTACTDADFMWFDLDSSSFVATRPANPAQHLFAEEYEASCAVSDSGGYDIGLGGYDLVAQLPETIELSAEFDDSCLRTFTSVDGDTGEETQGNTLSAEFDYEMENAVFVEGIAAADIDSTDDATIFQALTLSQLWIRSTFEDPTAITGDDLGLSAVPTITVSQDDTLSCQDESEVDATYLTGADCTPDGEIRTDCTYETCEPDFAAVAGTIWSSSENGGCTEYCTVQSCDDFGGATRRIYCAPECDAD